ncbi:MAG: hypothetical protein QM662_17410 [Gordonia sp. (in: high G+C Gram-positive bacteria)]
MTDSLRRVARLPGGVAGLVDRIAPTDHDECLRLLSISVLDALDLGRVAPIPDVLSQWRDQGRVSPATRGELTAAITRHEVAAALAHRAGDVEQQTRAFRRARAFHALAYAVDPDLAPTRRLAETAYEAATALCGAAGVVAVLVHFTP